MERSRPGQVAPGRYRAYAFEDVNSSDLQNPDLLKALEGRGLEIELKQSKQKQIQLPLITAGDYHQAVAQLGLESQ